MANFWKILYICFTFLPVIAYIISLRFIRLHKAHSSITALWALGFTYAFASLFSGFMIVHPKTYNSIWGTIAIFVTETSAGLEHWLFSLEYFTSADMISQKLNLKVPNKWSIVNKQRLFWSVSILYILLQIGLCSAEVAISKRSDL